jgi:hypothetical protein
VVAIDVSAQVSGGVHTSTVFVAVRVVVAALMPLLSLTPCLKGLVVLPLLLG